MAQTALQTTTKYRKQQHEHLKLRFCQFQWSMNLFQKKLNRIIDWVLNGMCYRHDIFATVWTRVSCCLGNHVNVDANTYRCICVRTHIWSRLSPQCLLFEDVRTTSWNKGVIKPRIEFATNHASVWFFFLKTQVVWVNRRCITKLHTFRSLDKGAQPTIASHVKQTESTSNLCGVANKLRGESKSIIKKFRYRRYGESLMFARCPFALFFNLILSTDSCDDKFDGKIRRKWRRFKQLEVHRLLP